MHRRLPRILEWFAHRDGAAGARPARNRVGWVVAVALVIAGACGSTENPGDEQVFCDLLESGLGLDLTAATVAEFDALGAVAPPDIRPQIESLRNGARDLDEILAEEPVDLEALFNRRFDPQAQQARVELDEYATSVCRIDVQRDSRNSLEDYLDTFFADRDWVDNIDIELLSSDGQLTGAHVAFIAKPSRISVAEDVCEVVSSFLYEVNDAEGSVRVTFDNDVLVTRAGPPDECQIP